MRYKITLVLIVVSSLTVIAERYRGAGGDAADNMVFSHTAGSGRIVFYGFPGGVNGLLGRPLVFVNGVAHGRIASGQYLNVDVDSGPVVACIWQPDHDCHTVQAANGGSHYFKVTYSHYPFGYDLTPVDAPIHVR